MPENLQQQAQAFANRVMGELKMWKEIGLSQSMFFSASALFNLLGKSSVEVFGPVLNFLVQRGDLDLASNDGNGNCNEGGVVLGFCIPFKTGDESMANSAAKKLYAAMKQQKAGTEFFPTAFQQIYQETPEDIAAGLTLLIRQKEIEIKVKFMEEPAEFPWILVQIPIR